MASKKKQKAVSRQTMSSGKVNREYSAQPTAAGSVSTLSPENLSPVDLSPPGLPPTGTTSGFPLAGRSPGSAAKLSVRPEDLPWPDGPSGTSAGRKGSRKLHLKLHRQQWKRLSTWVAAYNHAADRTTPKIKSAHVINRAILLAYQSSGVESLAMIGQTQGYPTELTARPAARSGKKSSRNEKRINVEIAPAVYAILKSIKQAGHSAQTGRKGLNYSATIRQALDHFLQLRDNVRDAAGTKDQNDLPELLSAQPAVQSMLAATDWPASVVTDSDTRKGVQHMHNQHISIMPFQGKAPQIHPSVLICDGVRIIGDVEIGEDCSIWFNTVLRGDVNSIRIGRRVNIQDMSMLHVTSATFPLTIADDVSIAHSVSLHGCTLQPGCLIGIGAIVLDGSTIGAGALVAAGALVREGQNVPPGVLFAGLPGKVVRELTPDERLRVSSTTQHYMEYAEQYRMKA
jgi:carbonic anhydrase/acetyltransferase-like protein (isoleucine patch superfamily)